VAGILQAAPGTALGYTAAPGYIAQDYVTGFTPNANGQGPIGLAFDQSDRLYVIDVANNQLYSFPPGGGQVSAATQVSQSSITGTPVGAAITSDGRLYVTRYFAKDIVEVSLVTGNVLRTAASGIPCATGLAVDPVSGDLFASQNLCGKTIFRVSGFASGLGSVAAYAGLDAVDGLDFGNDGTLYTESAGNVIAVSGTGKPQPSTATQLASVPHGDGLAFGLPPGSGAIPFLMINRLDGTVTRVDLATGATSDVLTGGTRGDFAAVDSHGCLYATQSDRIVRITAADGSCNLVPTTPGPHSQVASQLVVGCSRRKLVLSDVRDIHGHVELIGVADRTLVGHRVDIYFKATKKVVASTVVRSDGSFSTTAPLPPRTIRNTNRARYEARSGTEVSLNLKLERRMYVDSITVKNHRVTLTGRVTPPFTHPRSAVRVQRLVSCTRAVTVKRVKLRRNGRWRATLAAPPNAQAAIYRATTVVRKTRHTSRHHRTYTLPRVVAIP
jgi:sugar lactone lactonase YvrE